MTSLNLTPDLHGETHVGKVRLQNQDHFLACTLGRTPRVWATSVPQLSLDAGSPEPGGPAPAGDAVVAAVADGVGGGPGGEDASRTALTLLPSELQAVVGEGSGAESLEERLARAILRLHARLTERGMDDPDLNGMATTLSLWLGVGERAYVAQVGDSRCYRLRDGVLEQLSVDQTMAQDLVSKGLIPDLSQAPAGWDNILTSALGGSGAEPVVQVTNRRARDVILVCSDGVMKHIPDARLQDMLASEAPAEEIARTLVDFAVADGGVDNVTAVVLKEPE